MANGLDAVRPAKMLGPMRNSLIAGAVALVALVAVWLVAPGILGLGGGDPKAGPGGRVPVVGAATVTKDSFIDSIEAIGNALATESVTITAKVADTVGKINFTEGQQVEAGAILIEMTSTQQAADLAEARAALAEAEKAYQRAADLVAKGISSRAALDTATAARDAARSRVQGIEARLADTILKAPFAGVVGLRNVSVGSYVKPGDIITTLDDVSVVKGDFTVPERFLGVLKSGLSIDVEVAAYPDTVFKGTVASVDTRVDPVTRSVKIRAELPNTDGRLRPGMLMAVTLIIAERQALAVPESALIAQGDRRFVYLIDSASLAQRTEVKVGTIKPGSVEIISGLKEGDRVVSEGTNKVNPGKPVIIDGDPAQAPVADATGGGHT